MSVGVEMLFGVPVGRTGVGVSDPGKLHEAVSSVIMQTINKLCFMCLAPSSELKRNRSEVVLLCFVKFQYARFPAQQRLRA